MGIKSDLYDLASKVDTKSKELNEMVITLGTIKAKLDNIKTELSEIQSKIKSQADKIKE